MGHKVNPIGLRVGFQREYEATWYADKNYADKVLEDIRIRKALAAIFKRRNAVEKTNDRLKVSKVLIDKKPNGSFLKIKIYTGAIGLLNEITAIPPEEKKNAKKDDKGKVVVSKKVEKLLEKPLKGEAYIKDVVSKVVSNKNTEITIELIDVSAVDTDANILAQELAYRVEKKEGYKKVIADLIKRAMVKDNGINGIKVQISGRLDGNEIARTEHYAQGSVPLHTLKADIDYGFDEADTDYGKIGCKVWLYHQANESVKE